MFKGKLSKGFTLIELLVVIAIIGILSSVVLASMNSARKKSRDSRRQQDLKGIATALELYFDSNSQYPDAATAVRIVPATGTSVLNGLVTGGFLAALADDPLSSQHYYYISSGSSGSTSYCLGAVMENAPPSPGDSCPTLDPANSTNYHVGP